MVTEPVEGPARSKLAAGRSSAILSTESPEAGSKPTFVAAAEVPSGSTTVTDRDPGTASDEVTIIPPASTTSPVANEVPVDESTTIATRDGRMPLIMEATAAAEGTWPIPASVVGTSVRDARFGAVPPPFSSAPLVVAMTSPAGDQGHDHADGGPAHHPRSGPILRTGPVGRRGPRRGRRPVDQRLGRVSPQAVVGWDPPPNPVGGALVPPVICGIVPRCPLVLSVHGPEVTDGRTVWCIAPRAARDPRSGFCRSTPAGDDLALR